MSEERRDVTYRNKEELNSKFDENSLAILCQHCGSDYTHQKAMFYFDRGDDCKEVDIHYVIEGKTGSARKLNANSGNPSYRRDGIVILIQCEMCSKFSGINISQHKGKTFLMVEKAHENLVYESIKIPSDNLLLIKTIEKQAGVL
jgi:hypothetical protein